MNTIKRQILDTPPPSENQIETQELRDATADLRETMRNNPDKWVEASQTESWKLMVLRSKNPTHTVQHHRDNSEVDWWKVDKDRWPPWRLPLLITEIIIGGFLMASIFMALTQ